MARSFAGSDRISTSAAAILNPSGSFTASSWFNFNGGGNFNTIYASIVGTSTTPFRFSLYTLSASSKLELFSGSNAGVTSNSTFSNNVWHHAVVQYNFNAGTPANSTISVFIDGVVDSNLNGITAGAINPGSNVPWIIGDDRTGSVNNPYNGSMADQALWGVALTTAEIVALSKGARPYTVRPASLLGYWPLDGLQSPEPDLSGNANNGTLTNTALAFGPPLMMFTPRWPMITPSTTPPPLLGMSLIYM